MLKGEAVKILKMALNFKEVSDSDICRSVLEDIGRKCHLKG